MRIANMPAMPPTRKATPPYSLPSTTARRLTLGHSSRIEARDDALLAVVQPISNQFTRIGCRQIPDSMERLGTLWNQRGCCNSRKNAGTQVHSKQLPIALHTESRDRIPPVANRTWPYAVVHGLLHEWAAEQSLPGCAAAFQRRTRN